VRFEIQNAGRVFSILYDSPGVYIRDEDGKGSLIHASSKAGKVVSMPLAKYMNEQADRYIGFSAYEMKSPSTFFSKKESSQRKP
jgi:hypothetical protein